MNAKTVTFQEAIDDLLRTLGAALRDGADFARPRHKRMGNVLVIEWRGCAIALQARCAILSESWWLQQENR